ncbi:YdcF family protein [Sphingomonas lycopersici]|uniref:YdcF family protein n=1 Tax=Sphingomonas lycopersici TaxID=2951807 RepID=A0AA41Z9I5_9SPHN|nr:YdcF family protein [Sphingomonas lycopersici]MCW6535433.1 YdcF family protein [Sphingomonas lycopersici]
MRALFSAAALAVTALTAPASAEAVDDGVMATLSARLFPLLDAAGHDPAALERIVSAPGMENVLRLRRERRAACGADLVCRAQALLWSDREAAAMRRAVAQTQGLPAADDTPAAQVDREIAGINTIVRTYALGAIPATAIDGPGAVSPQDHQARLQAADWLAETPRDGSAQRLDPSIDYALALLDVSDRTDAIGHEPLTAGANAAAMARAKTLDWHRYRYSAMIVTGVGPEIEGEPLSPFGKYHLRLAARRFAQGDIAFILLTGGRAHPRATPFTEADEMRKALIDRYGVSPDAIVTEPYARHTTTNLRNAGRLLARLGAPLEAETVIVCNPLQSAYIESAKFAERNAAELGYQPGKVVRRVSPTELVFRPSRASERVDPRDPLDP